MLHADRPPELTFCKDYSLRAKDYNEKKARIRILRQKASERNPDEFYYGMYSNKTHDRGQKLASRGNTVLSHDAVKLLKTQDAGYLRTMAQQTRKAREKLEKGYVLKEGNGVEVHGRRSNSHGELVVYVESKEEQEASGAGRGVQNSVSPSNVSRIASEGITDSEKIHVKSLENQNEETANPAQISGKILKAEVAALKKARILRKQRKRDREAQLSRLKALETREKDLLAAGEELALQRAKMSHSVGGVNRAGVKFKVRERKR